MRFFTIFGASLIGLVLGAFFAALMIDMMGGQGQSWSAAFLAVTAILTSLLFALLGAWLTGSVESEQYAVAPTRHLVTLLSGLTGAGAGLGVYWLIRQAAGPEVMLAPLFAQLSSLVLMTVGGLFGLYFGRLFARLRIY